MLPPTSLIIQKAALPLETHEGCDWLVTVEQEKARKFFPP